MRNEEGATAVEYALLLGFIFVIIVSAVTVFGQTVTSLFDMGSVWGG